MNLEKVFKILVVDDIPSNIEFVNDVLESQDLQIIGATDGLEALDAAFKNIPDLILLDISMPQMDGYEVCEKLKSSPETKNIPVIFLTARVQKDDIIKGFEVGAVDYIIKPFNFNELVSRVRTHLDLKFKTEKLENINQELEIKVQERTVQLVDMNKDLTKANVDLTRAYEQLSILDKAKNDFISHINHELRTPLNGILGYASILLESSEDSGQKDVIKAINRLTNRLIKLAELSLLFTELKIKDHNVELVDVRVADCIDFSIESIDTEEKTFEIQLENIDDNLFIKTDEKLLSSCLRIVLDNAIKYSPDHGVITISIDQDETNIILSVSDEGPGFTDKAKEEVFNLFTADNLDYRSHGFGLGLATAKTILDLLKGELKLENKLTQGAKVSIVLQK